MLAIKASGMVTSAGFNSAASCAAMRAGIRCVSQTTFWDIPTEAYLTAGKVSLPHWWVGLGKLADLAAPAILECLRAAEPIPAERIPVLLGVAGPDRPFRPAGLDTELLGEIEERLGFRLHPASRVMPHDRTFVVPALRAAANLIVGGHVTCIIVAAVDSLIRQDLAKYYLSKKRLLTPKNSNGFSMGEAGSAVLVTSGDARPEGQLRIIGMGMAREKAVIESEEPLRAEGLIQAIREAFRDGGVTYDDVQYRITDLNGEHYKFKEMVLAMMRFQRKPKPKLFDLWHPIEYIGDVGAAIGPMILGLALHAGQKGYGVGPGVLCTLGNDEGERAALVARYEVGENSGE